MANVRAMNLSKERKKTARRSCIGIKYSKYAEILESFKTKISQGCRCHLYSKEPFIYLNKEEHETSDDLRRCQEFPVIHKTG